MDNIEMRNTECYNPEKHFRKTFHSIDAHLEPCRKFGALRVFNKNPILDVWQDSEYSSAAERLIIWKYYLERKWRAEAKIYNKKCICSFSSIDLFSLLILSKLETK